MAVELTGITKRFGAFVANDGIDLAVRRGKPRRISLALSWEGGAGVGLFRLGDHDLAVDDALFDLVEL
ncbi:hypothetical protein EN913_36830, partial [Mesorhizobium sp. M7A.F.Ca.CA.001.08.1.1]